MSLLAQPNSKELDIEALQPKTDTVNSYLQRIKSAILFYVLPTIWGQIRSNKKPVKKTAWLDGLRGFAAFLVVLLHHQGWGHKGQMGATILENAYGWNNEHYFITLPWIRVFFSGGHFAVTNFFAISGYVLSLAPLSILGTGDMSRFGDNVASALFRRWLRLYLPVFATTFLWFTVWHVFGIYSSNRLSDYPEPQYISEVVKWYHELRTFSFLYNEFYMNKYNDHLWTIALEMRGSIVVYTCLMAFSRSAASKRLMLQALLIWYFIWLINAWYCAAFLLGMMICDIDLLAERGELPAIFNWTKNLSIWFYVALFIFGQYLGGVPTVTEDIMYIRNSPGWYYLSFIKPNAMKDQKYIFHFIGALCNMICIPRISQLKGFFESNFCQYLGRISFSLYLVHGPVLWSIGDRVYSAVGCEGYSQTVNVLEWRNTFLLPKWGPFGLEVNYIFAQLILIPLTCWIAEIVTKTIDEPSLKFTKWLFKQTLPRPREEQKPYLQ